MVEVALALGNYIDLQEEEKGRLRAVGVVKYVLGELIRKGGTVEVASLNANPYGFTELEFKDAIQTLKQQEVVIVEESANRISIPEQAEAGSCKHFGRMYYMLLVRNSDPTLFGLPYYDSHINDELLNVICEIQGGLPLSSEQRPKAIELLLLSPSALLYALQPIPMIVNGRKDHITTPDIDREHADILFQYLFEGLRNDFNANALLAYFHEIRKKVELDFTTSIKVKSAKRVELEDQVRVRYRIGQWHQANAEGLHPYISMRAMNTASEPWGSDVPGPGQVGITPEKSN
jgi:hypothetical protein